MSCSDSSLSVEAISDILRKKYAIFTGAHDKEFRSLIVFPDVHSEPLPDESYSLLLQYFASLPATHAPVRDFAVLIDRRTSDWSSVKLVVSKLNQLLPSELKHIYVLKPQGLLQRFFVERTMAWIRDGSKYPINFVDRTTELLPFIDPAHLPTDVGGELFFSVDDWIRDRLSIESFRKKTECLCRHECILLSGVQRRESSASLNELDFGSGSVYILNPFYSPTSYRKLRKKRRRWLDRVVTLEVEGLQLRETLRSTTEPCEDSSSSSISPSAQADDSDTSALAHKGLAFELPVDRVFHVISLEHILVKLTEARAKCSSHWRQYIKLFRTVKLMADVEKQFLKLQPLAGVWENLLESALDYQPDVLPSTYQGYSPSSSADSKCCTFAEEPTNSAFGDLDFEGLESVLNRLREADQFGNHLVSDLFALSQTSNWLISCIPHGNLPAPSPICLGIASLTELHLDPDSDSDPESLTDVPHTCKAQETSLPPLVLPENSNQWPLLFDRLLYLAKTRLPQAVDQLSRLYELQCEISQARLWLHRGHSLVESIDVIDQVTICDLSACREQLQELVSLVSAREHTVKVLTDPRQFRLRFGSLLNPKLNAFLRELLKEVEDVDGSLKATIAALRQHISRISFPRHQPALQSLRPTDQKMITVPGSPEQVHPPALVDPLPSPTANEFANELEEVDKPNSDPAVNSLTDPVRRFNLAWEELVETERVYVKFLDHVHDVVWLGNLSTQRLSGSENCASKTDVILAPPFMSGNQSSLLANWPDLLYFHRDFLLPGLEECRNDSTKLKYWAFQMVPRLTDLYSVYCSVHPNTVHMAAQLERDRSHASWLAACSAEVHRREFMSSCNGFPSPSHHSVRPVLQLSSRLVTPVQRFQRYHLLINQLLRLALTETDRCELSLAHKVLVELCETVNLAMRFRGLSMRPSEMGRLLLRADFTVSRDDSRTNQQRHAFLFTNAILLTKFRNCQPNHFPTRVGSLVPPVSSTESSSEARERPANSHYLSSISLAANLASLVKAHGLSGSSNLPNDSGPVYEVREELPLSQIGLTPNVKADRRRFAVWTANRAQTYIFYTTDTTCRDLWVRSINDLLMEQLRRLREEALKRHLPQHSTIQLPYQPESTFRTQCNRSNSLPVSGEAGIQRTNDTKEFFSSLPSSTRKK